MSTEATNRSALDSSLWGVGRGVFVHTLIFPLEVTKNRLQRRPDSTSIKIAQTVLRQEGIGAFYQGLQAKLIGASIKQIWIWPTITTLPTFLKQYNINDRSQQLFTGLTIATIDAAIGTPFKKSETRSSVNGKFEYQLNLRAWEGFSAHWRYLSVSWSTCLISQQYLRALYQQQQQEPLTLPQLATIGTGVAVFVSLATAPLDLANTIKQADDLSLKHFLSKNAWHGLYCGWPLKALSLTIQNIATVTLIDKLSQK